MIQPCPYIPDLVPPLSLSTELAVPNAHQGVHAWLPIIRRGSTGSVSRSIQDFATGYNDGQLKCITMIGLVVIIHELDPWFENFWEQNWFTLDMLFVLFSSIMFFFHLANPFCWVYYWGLPRNWKIMSLTTRQWIICFSPSGLSGVAMSILKFRPIIIYMLCELWWL